MRSCLQLSGGFVSVSLADSIDEWNRLQTWERLLGLKGKPIKATPRRFADAVEVKTLQKNQDKFEQIVREITDKFFKGVLSYPDKPSLPIVWKN
jgi:hypothetical protein